MSGKWVRWSTLTNCVSTLRTGNRSPPMNLRQRSVGSTRPFWNVLPCNLDRNRTMQPSRKVRLLSLEINTQNASAPSTSKIEARNCAEALIVQTQAKSVRLSLPANLRLEAESDAWKPLPALTPFNIQSP